MTPIPYLGNKRRELIHISEYEPTVYNKVVDVFGGSGSISLYYLNKGCIVHYNDKIKAIVGFYDILKDEKRVPELIEAIKSIPNTDDEYKRLHPLALKTLTENKDPDLKMISEYLWCFISTGSCLFPSYFKNLRNDNYYANKAKAWLKFPPVVKDLKTTSLDYKELFELYKDDTQAFLILDPPYFSSTCIPYAKCSIDVYDDILHMLENAKCSLMLIVEFTGYTYHKFKDYIKHTYTKRYSVRGTKNKYKIASQKYHSIITNY